MNYVGGSRALFANPLAAELIHHIRAEEAGDLSYHRVAAVQFGPIVRQRADGSREQRVSYGVGIQRFVLAIAVTNIETVIGADFVIEAAGQRFSIVGLSERCLQPLEKTKRLLGVCRRSGEAERIKEDLAIVSEALLLVSNKEERLVFFHGAAE